jgi:DNA topoisomerase-1
VVAVSLKRLEELGVGRPSTYASILSTIQARGYVWKKGSALVPSFKAFAVIQLLEQHFGSLVDYQFTARMEDELDSIASGDEQSVPWLSRFYFGINGEGDAAANHEAPKNGKAASELDAGLRRLVAERLEKIDARAINSLGLGKDSTGTDVIIRVGRFGPYLQRGEDTANIPEDLPPDELTLTKAEELLATPSGDRTLGTDPESGLAIYARSGRFGSYIQLGEAGGKEKPKTASMLKTMSVDSVTLEQAIELLALPRHVGDDPETGQAITAQLGRFGPYLTREKETRSLEAEESVFTVTLEEALALFKQPKQRGQRKAAAALKTLGKDAVSGGEMTVREGRFGLYVTDGETNASFRKGDGLETVTPERAMELLQERRERGPVTKKKVVKKKAAAKKAGPASGAETTKKKKPAKKGGAKKTAKAAAPDVEVDNDETATSKPKKTSKAPAKASSKKKTAKKVASKKVAKKAVKKSADEEE